MKNFYATLQWKSDEFGVHEGEGLIFRLFFFNAVAVLRYSMAAIAEGITSKINSEIIHRSVISFEFTRGGSKMTLCVAVSFLPLVLYRIKWLADTIGNQLLLYQRKLPEHSALWFDLVRAQLPVFPVFWKGYWQSIKNNNLTEPLSNFGARNLTFEAFLVPADFLFLYLSTSSQSEKRQVMMLKRAAKSHTADNNWALGEGAMTFMRKCLSTRNG